MMNKMIKGPTTVGCLAGYSSSKKPVKQSSQTKTPCRPWKYGQQGVNIKQNYYSLVLRTLRRTTTDSMICFISSARLRPASVSATLVVC